MDWTIVYWTDPPWWGEGCRRLQEDGERGYTTNENSTHATKIMSSLFVVLFLSSFRKKRERNKKSRNNHFIFFFYFSLPSRKKEKEEYEQPYYNRVYGFGVLGFRASSPSSWVQGLGLRLLLHILLLPLFFLFLSSFKKNEEERVGSPNQGFISFFIFFLFSISLFLQER